MEDVIKCSKNGERKVEKMLSFAKCLSYEALSFVTGSSPGAAVMSEKRGLGMGFRQNVIFGSNVLNCDFNSIEFTEKREVLEWVFIKMLLLALMFCF